MTMKRKMMLLCAVFVFSSGCGYLAHMRELLTLKRLSQNQDEQEKFVEETDKHFEELMEAVRSGAIGDYEDQEAVRRAFGEPIYVEELPPGGPAREKWLYRYAVHYDREKVYLFFDGDGGLSDWTLVPAQRGGE